ncbi:MAG: hypothetical protein CCU26_12460 [Nitrospira sp. UW-LDO-01]|nr:MAG: hypothetical protein CCU26_12460 [Nitrospira sp. UW-LDO-01]
MSIYATLWRLKFPRYGDVHAGCEWIEVTAHIGSSTPGLGYEDGDPYAEFLPPALATDEDGDAEFMRAVVIITAETEKGTVRHPQEYSNPLLTLDGKQYASMTFDELHNRICDTLRGNRPRLILETLSPDGLHSLHFEDGTPRNS